MRERLIEEDLFTKYSIIDPNLPEGQKIHDFLLARAKALAGKHIDFEKAPVTFVLSDSKEPNAFFAPVFDPEQKPKPDEYRVLRYIKNPLDTPVICVTRGLIEMVDNLDQLDYILGHELTHMMLRGYGIEHNSKGEEEIADLHSVDLMYDADGDPKQALVMTDKFAAYSAKAKEKMRKRRPRLDEDEMGVDWAQILDVHMTHNNRKAAIEASLTRISHLIDDRTPSDFDKSVFDTDYSDPVELFLKQNGYSDKNAEDKLEILIDCVDHLSHYVSPEVFFKSRLDALKKEDAKKLDYETKCKIDDLQKEIDAGYPKYFHGLVVEKKYQQKIANLAEAIFEHENNNIDTIKLGVYLQDKAYAHILKNGYPELGSNNYRDASGILYSYFYRLFSNQTPDHKKVRDRETAKENWAQIDFDIHDAQKKIKNAKTAEEFITASESLTKLSDILEDIRDVRGGRYVRKLDNLSSIDDYNWGGTPKPTRLYPDVKGGRKVPWENLVELAKTDAKTKERIVKFLGQHHVADFRITHDLSYVRQGYSEYDKVSDKGILSEKKVPRYQAEFDIYRDLVLDAYGYIRAYFDNEDSLIDETCAAALNVNDQDFEEAETTTKTFKRVADKKIYDFISMFNALPDHAEDENSYDRPDVLSLIPERHRVDHPVPGSIVEDKSGYHEIKGFKFDDSLFAFSNPIFQEQFGENFKEEISVRKDTQQQKMFDTAFALVKKAVDIQLAARPKVSAVESRLSKLYNEIWGAQEGQDVSALQKEQAALRKKENFYRDQLDILESFIYNSLYSAFKERRQWYNLKRLLPQQNRLLADYVVRDEKDFFITKFQGRGYEKFCDYLGILEEQTNRVLAGDYVLTDKMQLVADNYGFKHVSTQENLAAFFQEQSKRENKYGNYRKYLWYLHVFDLIQHLEKTPAIGVYDLSQALSEIEERARSSYGDDETKLVVARYNNYRKLMTNSNVIKLVSRAIDYPGNYEDLSVGELLDTADSLLDLRRSLERILKSEHEKKFLNLLDKNARGILRKAEYHALKKENALEKITDLYRVYNHSKDDRSKCFSAMAEKEKRLEKISALSERPSFWPEDVLEHIKAFVFATNTFLDDIELENRILNDILGKLESLPACKKKNECLFVLLDKNLRGSYPETRERLFSIYVDDVYGKIGVDDLSTTYQKRLAFYLAALDSNDVRRGWDIGRDHGTKDGLLSNSISIADQYMILRRLSDTILSQEQTSQMIKDTCQIKLNSDDMVKSYLYGIGVDYLTEEMDADAQIARKFIEFFNSRGERKDCNALSAYIEEKMRSKYSDWQDRLDAILDRTKPVNCKVLYENFWSAPLQARAIVIARTLKSAVGENDGVKERSQEPWERVFNVVMDSIIRPDDKSTEAKYARDIMHSYIKERSDYERELILSAMMVANRNIGEGAGNVGKALKLFLENMGPAEIKLGQAIASHPNTPESIKVELQKLKNEASKPPRWTVYDWIRAEGIPEEFWKNEYLGEILGSASYYTTVALGENYVLRLLRPEAREKATKGFRVIGGTVEDLKKKEETSALDYRELTHSVQEMVQQAARMSHIETDHDIGQQQFEYAREVYNDVVLVSDAATFSLKAMEWNAKGKNWIKMVRAKGVTFNDLPEDTPEQITYKKRFAKAYISFEIMNVLSGRRFDHDKHGEQLCINQQTGDVGIFDTGAMALKPPTPEEQEELGHIIYDVVKKTGEGQDPFSSFSQAISDKIHELHQENIGTQYLVEVKKGLLALGDFFKVLDKEDIHDLVPGIDMFVGMSEHIQKGIAGRMSRAERAQLKIFLKAKIANKKNGVQIHRTRAPKPSGNVVSVNTKSGVSDKASWLKQIFSSSGDTKGHDLSSFFLANDDISYDQLHLVAER